MITDGWSRQQSQATSNPVSTGLIDQVLTTLSALYRAFDKYVSVKKREINARKLTTLRVGNTYNKPIQ